MSDPEMKLTLNLFALAIAIFAGPIVGLLAGVMIGEAFALTMFWRIVVGFVVATVTTSAIATWLEDDGYLRH